MSLSNKKVDDGSILAERPRGGPGLLVPNVEAFRRIVRDEVWRRRRRDFAFATVILSAVVTFEAWKVYRQSHVEAADAIARLELRKASSEIERARDQLKVIQEASAIQMATEYASTEMVATAFVPTVENKRFGYVYLGICDNEWVSSTFDGLPPCRSEFPNGGVDAYAKRGIKVRAAPPRGGRYGDEVTRVKPGSKVHFVSVHAMTLTEPSLPGPNVYWGEIELPLSPER